MFNVVIVGAGQLGSRHLQGLQLANTKIRVYVVDPSEASLLVAKTRFEEVAKVGSAAVDEVSYHTQLGELPKSIDLAIIATNSNVRLRVLADIIQHAHLKYLVLEKVLFPEVEQYFVAERLLKQHKIKSWVNCPNRTLNVYSDIKRIFTADRLLRFDVSGGNWGLGCNSVHYLDLIQFITGEVVQEFSVESLDRCVYPSKRQGFIEFAGLLSGQTETGVIVTLSSKNDSSARPLVMIRGESSSMIVDQAKQKLLRSEHDGEWKEELFRLPMQSERTGSLVDTILESGSCNLPTYEDSLKVHLPFLGALMKHLKRIEHSSCDICGIT